MKLELFFLKYKKRIIFITRRIGDRLQILSKGYIKNHWQMRKNKD